MNRKVFTVWIRPIVDWVGQAPIPPLGNGKQLPAATINRWHGASAAIIAVEQTKT